MKKLYIVMDSDGELKIDTVKPIVTTHVEMGNDVRIWAPGRPSGTVIGYDISFDNSFMMRDRAGPLTDLIKTMDLLPPNDKSIIAATKDQYDLLVGYLLL